MKKTNKIIALACALMLTLNFLTVISVAGGTGTEADPYIITTAAELQNINNNVSAHYKLGANIDLKGIDFVPLGNADSGAFAGSFDGNGYTVKNLDIFSGKFAGLFGSNEGIIRNVILENIYVYGTRYIGGVVAYNTALGTVENCKVISGLIETDGGINNISIGGVCGLNEGAFNGSFSNGADIEGTASDVNVYAGGICGYWNSSISKEMTNSYNKGNISISISSSQKSYSGGIIGYIYSTVIFRGSYNTGNVLSSSLSNFYTYTYTGGFVGYASSNVTINESYNTGVISSSPLCHTSSSGGFVGYTGGSTDINRSYNTGNISSSYSDYYSPGSSSSYSSGGFIGTASAQTNISGSYNTGIISCSYVSSYSSSSSYTFKSYSGGFVGNSVNIVTINESYNNGNVVSSCSASYVHDSFSGGLIGYSNNTTTISDSYNTGNISSSSSNSSYYSSGLVGYAKSTINCGNSYSIYGSVVSGRVLSGISGVSLSWSDMKNMSSYTGWNFDEIWSIGGNCNYAYPVLRATSSPLTIDIPNKIMASGETIQLTTYKNGVKTTDVKWSVTNGLGSVSSTGLVSPGLGMVTVTATDSEGNKANFNAFVFSKATSLTATNRTLNLSEGRYSNSDYVSLSGGSGDFISSWESSDTSVVKVSADGYLTPVSVGTATITITSAGGLSATQTVTVTDVATNISLPSTLTVNRCTTQKITATTSPNATSSTITWKSSDESVATVDSEGNVTGLKCGTTTITATTDNGYSSNCIVTVNAPITEIAFETPSLTLYTGQTYKLKLNITPTNTTDTITYSSSSTSRASVSSAGTVTAKSTGNVTITATSSSGIKAYCNITIKAWPSVFVPVDSAATTITNDVIMTDTTGIKNINRLLTLNDGYNINVNYSYQADGLNYCGTGTTIDVYDDYGNFVITYKLVVNGDVNGDSVCDVLDASAAYLYSFDFYEATEMEAYAANGCISDVFDTSSYQNVVNMCMAS